jgi:Ca-activated chloride channel family protein
MRATDTLRRDNRRKACPPSFSPFAIAAVIFAFLFCGVNAFAQNPQQIPPPPGAVQNNGKTYTLKKRVDMVRLPVSIIDKKGNFVPGLQQDNFRVLENNNPQKIAAFTHEDVPISVGLVIDNSGSMRSKRARVNEAAMDFVKTSNPQDQTFVVNFNDEYYLDMDEDFTNDPKVLRAALERIDSRGGTALYDAVLGSMHHLRKGTRQKKVLLVITDGEDHDSTHNLAYMVQKLEQSNVEIYAVGLFTKDDDSREEIRHGKKALEEMAQASGGEAFFPKTLDDVNAVCLRIAQDIRDQYMIGYYPTNTSKDGTFRTVKVELVGVKHEGKLTVRARPGYYAPSASSAGGETASEK